MVGFIAGELFNSFSDLQLKLSEYSEQQYCHFYIKDSKKLSPEEVVNPNLIYKHIVYSCIYGGQKPRFRGSGSRSVTSIRHGCMSSLYLRVTKDRAHLQVRSFVDEHNHDVTEDLYRSAAQDKKLPWDLKAEVEELLLLGADKDRLCEYIRHVSKKNLDKKNLFNMYETAIKQQREISRERAVMLVQKAYAVDTEEEAEQILTQLLDTTRTPRRIRKQEQQLMEDVQYAYVNDGDASQVDGDVSDETLQRLMGSLSGGDGERIVIVQGDEQFEVIDAGNAMEVSEYLDDDDKDEGELMIKQESNKDDESETADGETTRFITLKDVYRNSQPRKRAHPNNKERSKILKSDNTILYEPTVKTRILSNQYVDGEETLVTEADGLTDEADIKLALLKVEQDKLLVETEMLKLKKNKIVREISVADLKKNKLFLEIDYLKQNKKFIMEKTNWLANDNETKLLKNEKLRLEIAKLKLEMDGREN